MAQIMKYKLFCEPFEVSIGLYESIDNLSEVLDLTQNHNFCLIDAKAVFDVNQVLCAVSKSTNAKLNNKLITKQLNKEILFSLSPSKNINESLKTFGVDDSNQSSPIMALVVHQSEDINDSSVSDIFDKIRGKLLPIDALKNLREESLIESIYKLQNCTNDEHKWNLIVTRIAVKDLI